MEKVPHDVLVDCMFIHYFDGKDLSNVRMISTYFRDLVDSNERLKNRFNYHLIYLHDVRDVYEAIGEPKDILTVSSFNLPFFYNTDGLRCYRDKKRNDVVVFLNDFYDHHNGAITSINELKVDYNVLNYKLIMYPAIKGVGRFQLSKELGTIHRGTMIWLKYIQE